MKAVGKLMSVGALLAAPVPALAADLCTGLRTVAADAGSKFQSLRGAPIRMTDTWTNYQGIELLAGANKCVADPGVFRSYECEWHVRSQGELKAKQAELVNAVRQCFPGAYSAAMEKGEIDFWVGAERQPGAFKIGVRPFKVRGDRFVNVAVSPY